MPADFNLPMRPSLTCWHTVRLYVSRKANHTLRQACMLNRYSAYCNDAMQTVFACLCLHVSCRVHLALMLCWAPWMKTTLTWLEMRGSWTTHSRGTRRRTWRQRWHRPEFEAAQPSNLYVLVWVYHSIGWVQQLLAQMRVEPS